MNFGSLTFNDKRKTYVSPPIQQIANTMDFLDNEYRTNRDKMDQLQIAAANIDVRDQEQGIKDEAINAINSEIDTIIADGDLEYATDRVKSMVTGFGTNQKLIGATKVKKAADEYNQKRDAIRMSGKTALEFSRPEDYNYVNEDGTVNNMPSFHVEEELDSGTKVASLWKQMVESDVDSELAKANIAGWTEEDSGYLKAGRIEKLSANKINALGEYIYTIFKNTPEGSQMFRKYTDIDKQDMGMAEAMIKDDVIKMGMSRIFKKDMSTYQFNQMEEARRKALEKSKEEVGNAAIVTTLYDSSVPMSLSTGISDSESYNTQVNNRKNQINNLNKVIVESERDASNEFNQDQKKIKLNEIERLKAKKYMLEAETEQLEAIGNDEYRDFLNNPYNNEGQPSKISEKLTPDEDYAWASYGKRIDEEEMIDGMPILIDEVRIPQPIVDAKKRIYENVLKIPVPYGEEEKEQKRDKGTYGVRKGIPVQPGMPRYVLRKDLTDTNSIEELMYEAWSNEAPVMEGDPTSMTASIYNKLTANGKYPLTEETQNDVREYYKYLSNLWSANKKADDYEDDYMNIRGQQELTLTTFDFQSTRDGSKSAASKYASDFLKSYNGSFSYVIDGQVLDESLETKFKPESYNVSGVTFIPGKGWAYTGYIETFADDERKIKGAPKKFHAIPNASNTGGIDMHSAIINTLTNELSLTGKMARSGNARDLYNHMLNADTEGQLSSFIYTPVQNGEEKDVDFYVNNNKNIKVTRKTTSSGDTSYILTDPSNGKSVQIKGGFWDTVKALDEYKAAHHYIPITNQHFKNGTVSEQVERFDIGAPLNETTQQPVLNGELLMSWQQFESDDNFPKYEITSMTRSIFNESYSPYGHNTGIGLDIVGEGSDNQKMLDYFKNKYSVDLTDGKRHDIPGEEFSILYHQNNENSANHFDIKLK